MQLAEVLADTFTVYLPDRRGRGLSGPYSKGYSVQKEVEGMDALLTKTGAHNDFGISGGALTWLEAALVLPAIHKAVIFEPPLSVNCNWSPGTAKPPYDKLLAQGKVDSALVLAMKVTQMGPPILRAMPNWLLERFTNRMLASEDKKAKPDDVTMRMLAPIFSNDMQQVIESSSKGLERFRAIRAEVLLMFGSTSPAFLKVPIDTLEKILPHVRRVELAGLDHGASGNADRGGKPEVEAQELRRFFT